MANIGGAELQKFATLELYLERHHKKFYAALVEAGLAKSLAPRGNREDGVTILIPDAKHLAAIDKVLSSANTEEATDMLSALIISGYFPTVKSMEGKSLINRLGKKIIIKEIKPAMVVIDDGTIKPDAAFKPIDRVGTSKRGNMAVWHLTGTVEYKNAPSGGLMRPREAAAAGHRNVEGGHDGRSLQELYHKVMEEKKIALAGGPRAKWQLQRQSSSGRLEYCPVLVAVAKIMAGSRICCQDQAEILLSVGSGIPTVDFILICCSGLFDCAKIWHAYEAGASGDSAVTVYRTFWSTPLSTDVLALNPAGRREINEIIAEMKDNISTFVARSAVSEINAFYSGLAASKGAVDGRQMFPVSLIAAAGKDCCKLRCVQGVVFGMSAALYAAEETLVADKDAYAQEYQLILSDFVTSDCCLPDVSALFSDSKALSAIERGVRDENMINLFRMAFLMPMGDEADQRIVLGGDEDGDTPVLNGLSTLNKYDPTPLSLDDRNKALFRSYIASHDFTNIEGLLDSLK